MRFVALYLALCFYLAANAQDAVIFGFVYDGEGAPLKSVAVLSTDNRFYTESNEDGRYQIKLPLSANIKTMVYSYAGLSVVKRLPFLESGIRYRIDVQLDVQVNLKEATVKQDRGRSNPGTLHLDPKILQRFPNTNPGIEQFIKTLPGVSVSNELSSAYNVRGGNFDENLVYVNDIEVYRPFLVRSGQQEGLSFVNPDLVENISFSAGGFEAQYGDKLSSVLDITYKEPDENKNTLRFDFMGTNLSTEGKIGERFSYLIGARYFTNQYVLNSLDVQGDYKPRFYDVQSYLRWEMSKSWDLGWLFTASENRFLFIPQARETRFGTAVQALRLYVGFAGQELMQYRTFTNGLNLRWKPNPSTELKWIASIYSTNETEQYTVEGAYRLEELENNLGSDNFAEARSTLGFGYFIHHARNSLNAQVSSFDHKGRMGTGFGTIRWGVGWRHEAITDRLREWKYNDSAGYNASFSNTRPGQIILDDVIRSDQQINSHRWLAYLQNTQLLSQTYNLKTTYGLRTHYWSFNGQNTISPRVQFSAEPNKEHNRLTRMRYGKDGDSLLKKDILIRAAWGYYYQPPFYREMRNLQGELNRDIRAQRALHYVLGADWNFSWWNRPFKFYGELYYKQLNYLIPYVIDNVRIRYYADNSSRGYASGMDFRINGEFIKGLESWFSLSLLKTDEDIRFLNSQGELQQSGFLRRPTDQRVNASILFQDELRKNPDYKMHLRLVFGSGVPYYFTGDVRYQEGFTIPPYRRVDLGFSKIVASSDEDRSRWYDQLWLSVEIFNLLQVNNTVSYLWIKDINNNTYGIPNFLTGRRLNFRLTIEI